MPQVIEGTVEETTFDGKKGLFLTMPRKPQEAHMSFPIDSACRAFLNKKIRMTIDEKRITIEKLEK